MLDNSDTNSEDEVDAFNRIVLDAMVACKPIEYMHIAGLNNLVHAILASCDTQEQNPTVGLSPNFIKKMGRESRVNAMKCCRR